MLTAREILPPDAWDAARACDSISLDFDERHRRRFHYVAAGGTAFLLDLRRATVLRDGDGLALSDGRVVAVRAAPEPLMEACAAEAGAMLRLAWHIGNRHLPAELHADAIRLRRDHVIQAMLEGLGAQVIEIEAAFSPEQGAYAGSGDHGPRVHDPADHDHAHNDQNLSHRQHHHAH